MKTKLCLSDYKKIHKVFMTNYKILFVIFIALSILATLKFVFLPSVLIPGIGAIYMRMCAVETRLLAAKLYDVDLSVNEEEN